MRTGSCGCGVQGRGAHWQMCWGLEALLIPSRRPWSSGSRPSRRRAAAVRQCASFRAAGVPAIRTEKCACMLQYVAVLDMRTGTRAVQIVGVQADFCLDHVARMWPNPIRFRPSVGRRRPNLDEARLGHILPEVGRVRPNLARIRPALAWNWQNLGRDQPKLARIRPIVA